MTITPENQVKLVQIQKKHNLYTTILESLEYAKDNLNLSGINVSGEITISGQDVDVRMSTDSDSILDGLITELENKIRYIINESNKLCQVKTS